MRLVVGYFETVLRDRGIRFSAPRQALRECLQGLDEASQEVMGASLRALAAGVDRDREVEHVQAIDGCAQPWVRERLEALGLQWHHGRVAAWAMAHGDWRERLDLDAGALCRSFPQVFMECEAEDSGVHEASAEVKGEQERDRGTGDVDGALDFATRGATSRTSKPAKTGAVAGVTAGKAPRGHHVYGSRGAVEFQLDTVRRPREKERANTVRIEAAKSLQTSGRSAASLEWVDEERDARRYDWDDNLIFQLTLRELHQAAAVAIGASDGCTFKRVADDRNKTLELRSQPGGMLVRLTQSKLAVAVPVGADDMYSVAVLFMAALSANDPEIDQAVLLSLVRATAGRSASAG